MRNQIRSGIIMSSTIRLLLIFSIVLNVMFFSNGVAFASVGDTVANTTPAASTQKVCPVGTTANQDLGTCAQCENAAGCSTPVSDPAAVPSCTKASCNLILTYLDPFIDMLSALVGVACVISLIMAGIMYTTSEGDPGKASAAKGRIMMTLVAFIAFIFLYSFLQFIIPGGIFNPGS
jgi:hypothetical protein